MSATDDCRTAYGTISEILQNCPLYLLRYSPEVESFGIDESWIELTGSPLLQQKTPLEIANEIRTTVKEEVGLTVSIGVSFNKILRNLAQT